MITTHLVLFSFFDGAGGAVVQVEDTSGTYTELPHERRRRLEREAVARKEIEDEKKLDQARSRQQRYADVVPIRPIQPRPEVPKPPPRPPWLPVLPQIEELPSHIPDKPTVSHPSPDSQLVRRTAQAILTTLKVVQLQPIKPTQKSEFAAEEILTKMEEILTLMAPIMGQLPKPQADRAERVSRETLTILNVLQRARRVRRNVRKRRD